MVNRRAVVVEVVSRRAERARAVRHLLEVVVRVRRALHVVKRPPRRPRRRRGVDARHLRVGFYVHCYTHWAKNEYNGAKTASLNFSSNKFVVFDSRWERV